MSHRNGSLLENNVTQICSSVGLTPEQNAFVLGYEIDVYVEYMGKKIGIECKQYERSNITVRNLIHEWYGKNRELNFDKLVLVILGPNVQDSDYELANKSKITLWDTDKFYEIYGEALKKKQKYQKTLLNEFGFSNSELSIMDGSYYYENNREKIDELINKTNFEGIDKSEIPQKLKMEYHKNKVDKEYILDFVTGLFSKDDKKKILNMWNYRGVSYWDLSLTMSKYKIKKKNIARILMVGGSIKGKKYTKRSVDKMTILLDNFDMSFNEASDYVLIPGGRKKSIINNLVKIKNKNPDLKFIEINKSIGEKLYAPQTIGKNKEKKNYKIPEKYTELLWVIGYLMICYFLIVSLGVIGWILAFVLVGELINLRFFGSNS